MGLPGAFLVAVLVLSLPAVGVFRIAYRAGYKTATCLLWAVGFAVPPFTIAAIIGLGFLEWPRDRSRGTLVVLRGGAMPVPDERRTGPR